MSWSKVFQPESYLWLALLVIAAAAAAAKPSLPVMALETLDTMQNEGLNRVDQGAMVRGYYQNLTEEVDEFRGGIPERFAGWMVGRENDQAARRLTLTDAARDTTEGYLVVELVPGANVEHLGVPVNINRWGQRDRDYELQKAPGTFRIAFIGASNSMGWGVRMEEGYVERLEDRLNRDLSGKSPHARFEVINFSVPGNSLTDFLYIAEVLAPPFEPDLVIVETCYEEIRFNVARRVAGRFKRGRDLRYPDIKEIVQRSGVSRDEPLFRLRRRMNSLREPLLFASYRQLAAWSSQSGIPVALAVLHLEAGHRIEPVLLKCAAEAERLGIIPLRVFNVFDKPDTDVPYLSHGTDHHPSAKAHALLADDLYEQLLKDPRTRKLLIDDATGGDHGS